jgi:hypothetical protein
MKTLLTLFDKQRSELQTQIEQATNPEQVVRLVQTRLDAIEKTYIGNLSVTQVRLTAFFLDTLRQSLAALSAAQDVQLTLPEIQTLPKPAPKSSTNRLILKVVQVLICTGIFGSLLSLTPHDPQVWMPILLVLALVGLEVVVQLEKKPMEENSVVQMSAIPQPVLRVDSQVLLDNLADALHTIDQAIARTSEVSKSPDSSRLEELPELLNLIQRLSGASFLNKPQMAMELTKLLPQVLIEQGIVAQVYHPDPSNSNRQYFDFEPSIDPSTQEYITITPALFKGDRLLRRGRVIEPTFFPREE